MTHGFALPISHQAASKIQNGLWAPLNITEQWTINEKGEHIEKKCLTQDQSFESLESKVSINDRLDKEKCEPLIYGFMLLCLLHMIHAI